GTKELRNYGHLIRYFSFSLFALFPGKAASDPRTEKRARNTAVNQNPPSENADPDTIRAGMLRISSPHVAHRKNPTSSSSRLRHSWSSSGGTLGNCSGRRRLSFVLRTA